MDMSPSAPGSVGSKYYSANGEDCLLWLFFGPRPHGRYLDVGAFDGIHFSNTYSFELGGWTGVCVEPHPTFYPALVRNRPGAVCLRAACVADRRQRDVILFNEELGLLSTTRKTPGYDRFVSDRYEKRGLAFRGFREERVPAVTVDDIIERHLPGGAPLEIVSIDVEGAEMEVLRGFDVSRHGPEVLIVESNLPDQTALIIAHLEAAHRYFYAGTLVENLFFARTEADAARLRSIRVRCAIEPQTHPLGERFTPEPYLTGKALGRERPLRLRRVMPAPPNR
jgi:FkbM family methyltransferase